MKRSNSFLTRVGVFTLNLLILTLTVFYLAQTYPKPGKATLESNALQPSKVEYDLESGWLGLLGLAGIIGLSRLASLSRKKQEDSTYSYETDEENYFG